MADDPREILFGGELQRGIVGDDRVADVPPVAADPSVPDVIDSIALSHGELAWFSHGLFFTHVGLDARHDPVAEFVAANPGVVAGFHDFASPIFSGIAHREADEAWDRRLFFVARDAWPALLEYMGGVAFLDRRGHAFHRAVPQVVVVLDRAAIERGPAVMATPLPSAHVTVFGLAGTRYNLAFSPANPHDLRGVSRVVPATPRGWVRREAERALGGDRDPFRR